MTLIFADWSDNNALPLPVDGLAGCMLKVYQVGDVHRGPQKGYPWFTKAFAQVKAVFPPERVGFYEPGDSAPMWSQQKAAILALGTDPRDHPWALDFEFGYTSAAIRAVMADAAADGMTCRGLYQRTYQALGQTWDWRSIVGNRLGNQFPNMVLDQYVTVPFDHDRSNLDAAAWAAATVASYQPPGDDMTEDEVKALIRSALTVASDKDAQIQAHRNKAVSDVLLGKPKRVGQGTDYDEAFDEAKGTLAAAGGALPPGTKFAAEVTTS